MLHKPASEHGCGEFFDPLIEHRGRLLSEICGVGKAGEFIALKAISRCRQQEFPRGKDVAAGHGFSPE
jgi:hypothetical protein